MSVTYTDVHFEQLAFFQDMLKPHGVKWQGDQTAMLAAGAPFYLATGVFDAADAETCRAYLEFLGSHLVFFDRLEPSAQTIAGLLAERGSDCVAPLGRGRRDRASRIPWNWEGPD